MNLGAGLDTAFYRVDNGSIEWYDLDLPKVIALRKQLLPETDRVKCIAKSLFDTSWCADMEHTNNGIFILAKGILWFFEEAEIRRFFSSLADALPGTEFIFESSSKLGASIVNNSLKSVDMDVEVKWELEDARVITQWDRANLGKHRCERPDQRFIYCSPMRVMSPRFSILNSLKTANHDNV
jgi:O-methyltransferase involved in polyketide biosynthesis